ncbi:hypothetical protein RBU61_13940 [Tissierella sp. MB52-C2]|uniref:hypothetical protein n=1 Tax=Tissierella sp. MB52-C2 TaxID=3070999 RepID=UPI00280AFC42|nr:hypothetical protein [Tissierella sp. MB52-C2]WMM24016.1 hypothetical protein RBU61_13940 [Tissierella sp. MB52-C2]
MVFLLATYDIGREFYIGKTYISEGELYPCVGSKEEAKKYTSKKRLKMLAID